MNRKQTPEFISAKVNRMLLESNKAKSEAKREARKQRTHKLVVVGAMITSIFPSLLAEDDAALKASAERIARAAHSALTNISPPSL